MKKSFRVTIDGRETIVENCHPDNVARAACVRLGLPDSSNPDWWHQSDEANRAVIELMPRPIFLADALYGSDGEVVLDGVFDESDIDGTSHRTFGAFYESGELTPGLSMRRDYRSRLDDLAEAVADARARLAYLTRQYPAKRNIVCITAYGGTATNGRHALATYYLSEEQAAMAWERRRELEAGLGQWPLHKAGR